MATKGSKVEKSDLVKAVTAVAVLLKEPHVQEQLRNLGSGLAERIRSASSRASGQGSRVGVPGGLPSGVRRALPPVSPQRRLQNRVDKLAGAVELLRGATTAGSSDALGAMDEVIERVRLSLAVAATLPARRRTKRHREISRALGDLEDALAAATGVKDLGGVPDAREELSDGSDQTAEMRKASGSFETPSGGFDRADQR